MLLRVHTDSCLVSYISTSLYVLLLIYIRLRRGYCQGVFQAKTKVLYWSDILTLVNTRSRATGVAIKDSLSSRASGDLCLSLEGGHT